MKKHILFLLIFVLVILITSCGSVTNNIDQKNETEEVFDSSSTENNDMTNNDDLPVTEPSNNGSHYETVRTYFVYAEQGAVITWYDPQTGAFRYKDKCETCGKVGNSEHGGGLRVVEGMGYTASYCCVNSKCSMWGKPQPVKISSNFSTEWVEVND